MTAARAVLRPFVWRYPEWWIWAVAAGAWLWLAVDGPGPAGHAHVHAKGGPGWATSVTATLAMTVAMMSPLAIPGARHVSLTSFWDRRHRSQAAFLAGYLGTWVAAAALLALAVDAVARVAGDGAAVAMAFGVAATWQLAPAKRRALKRCRRTAALASAGWEATRDCIRYGAGSGGRCVVTCWGLMAGAAAAGHAVPVMAVVLALQIHERVADDFDGRTSAAAVVALGAATLVI